MILFLLVLLANGMSQAQIENQNRYEIKYEWRYENHLVVSNEERGLTLIQTNKETGGRTFPVKFTHLDQEMKEVWKDSIRVSNKLTIRGYHYLKDRMFVMFQDYPVRKRIKILSLDYKTQTITEHETSQIAELVLSEFEVIKNTAVLGGYFEQRPVVFAYDLEKDRVTALRGVYKNNSELLEVRVNKDSVTFNVLVAELNDQKDQTVIVNTYDFEGNPIRNYTLETEKDYSLIDGVSSSINDITQVVVGNYGYKSTTLPSGIYINHVNRRGEQTMKYINYGELPRFLDYLNPGRAGKVKSKALESKEKGKEQRYKLQALARELVEIDDKLILQVEYFKPAGNNRPISNREYYGYWRTLNDGYSIPDETRTASSMNRQNSVNEFDFTHAYALVMDQNGKVLWDDTFNMKYTHEGALDQHGRFQWIEEKQHLVFAHYDDDEIFAKVLDGTGEWEIQVGEVEIDEEDNKKDELEYTVEMVKWYGDYFLIHGIQNLRPKDRSSPAGRVFFINAIKLNPEGRLGKLD